MKTLLKRSGLIYYLLVSFLFFLCLLLYFVKPRVLTQLELKTYDWRMYYSLKRPLSGKIVIAAIDEKSIKHFGRWESWSRTIFSEVIKKISKMRPAVIAIDVLYTEKSKNDKLLVDACKNSVSVGSMAFKIENIDKNIIEIPDNLKKFAYQNVLKMENLLVGGEPLLPFDELLNCLSGVGFINMLPDDDGVLRRELAGILYGNDVLKPLSIETYRIYKKISEEDILFVSGQSIFIQNQKIPLDRYSMFLIDYAGGSGVFPIFSLYDIYNDLISEDAFKDKIVLVGATALGLYDMRITPTSHNMAGIEKHAYVIESLLNNRFIYQAHFGFTIFMMFLSYLIFLLSCNKMKVQGTTIIGLSIFFILTLANFIIFSWFRIWINYVYPMLTNLIIFIGVIVYKYSIEEAKSREIKRIFSSYVSDKIVNELIKNPEMAKLGGTKKEITVLFADVRGFTAFSERHTPEKVVEALNELLTAMTDVIMEHDGTLDKFVGDEIMALWNVPLEQDNHAFLAVKCAIAMIRKNRELIDNWKKEGKEPLCISIGLNTGFAVVGNMGAEGKKMDYTVIGDTVNLGARIEALTRNLDADILISGNTYDKIKSNLNFFNGDFIECPNQQVKGKKEEVRIYKILVK